MTVPRLGPESSSPQGIPRLERFKRWTSVTPHSRHRRAHATAPPLRFSAVQPASPSAFAAAAGRPPAWHALPVPVVPFGAPDPGRRGQCGGIDCQADQPQGLGHRDNPAVTRARANAPRMRAQAFQTLRRLGNRYRRRCNRLADSGHSTREVCRRVGVGNHTSRAAASGARRGD